MDKKTVEKIIIDAYRRVLGRSPDQEGMRDFTRALCEHMQASEIDSVLRRGEEYARLHKEVHKGLHKGYAYIDINTNHIIWLKSRDTDSTSNTESSGIINIYPDIIKNDENGITIVSTWGIKCGIATYTKFILSHINKIHKAVNIKSINNGIDESNIGGAIVHIQHEYGIIPKTPKSDSKIIITFHTVKYDIGRTISEFEDKLNVVAYVAHFDEAKKIISSATKKEVHLIPHGSMTIPGADNPDMKVYARRLLRLEEQYGLKDKDDCALVFGFQSGDKNYNRVMTACINAGIKLIISGGKHQCGYTYDIDRSLVEKVIFLDSYLNEMEIDLYALASDMFIFDYRPLNHFSCSGAMHRILGAGRPIICSRTNHFVDIIEDKHCLKFDNQQELELKIKQALDNRDELGRKALELAKATSWDSVAMKHLTMYQKYIGGNQNAI